jgi:hypothetical protein
VRLVVRTTPEFWVSLDAAMPAGREPSWYDFAAVDLPGIVERVAGGWQLSWSGSRSTSPAWTRSSQEERMVALLALGLWASDTPARWQTARAFSGEVGLPVACRWEVTRRR